MDTTSTPSGFLEIIKIYPEDIQKLAIELRSLIFDIHPNVVEVLWSKQKVVGYGLGPKKMSEHYCYMVFAKKHVTFGFNYGADLPDPAGLLTGTGKRFRSTKLGSFKDIHSPNLSDLIKSAIKERKSFLHHPNEEV